MATLAPCSRTGLRIRINRSPALCDKLIHRVGIPHYDTNEGCYTTIAWPKSFITPRCPSAHCWRFGHSGISTNAQLIMSLCTIAEGRTPWRHRRWYVTIIHDFIVPAHHDRLVHHEHLRLTLQRAVVVANEIGTTAHQINRNTSQR